MGDLQSIEAFGHLASICGLNCGTCAAFLASHESSERLEAFAARLGLSPEDAHCEGCRSERRCLHCRDCHLADCARERGLTFCGECPEYPCASFQAFQKARPHRIEIPSDMARILEVGPEVWLQEAQRRYACTACGAPNSAYDLRCRQCGAHPATDFAREHGEVVHSFLTRSSR